MAGPAPVSFRTMLYMVTYYVYSDFACMLTFIAASISNLTNLSLLGLEMIASVMFRAATF